MAIWIFAVQLGHFTQKSVDVGLLKKSLEPGTIFKMR